MPDIYKDLNYTAEQVDDAIAAIGSHIANNSIHVNRTEKDSWNAKADSSALSAETSAREAADTALQTAVNSKADASALTSEISARETADASINSRISAIETDQQRQETEIGVVAALGAKNLLKVTASSGVLNTATIDIADDGSIHISGQPTGNGAYVISSGIELVIPENSYILSIGAEAGNTKMSISLRRAGTSQYVDLYSAESRIIPAGTYDRAHIYLYSDTAYDTTVYPMIRRAEITDDTFAPYAPTNRELYEEKKQLQAKVDQITGTGQQIPSNADLNSYYDPGVYQILTSAIAKTLVNIPSDCKVAGSIEVKILNGNARMQFYYPNWASSGTNPGSFYFRQRTGATDWSAWYYFSGTQAASASTQSAPASLMQAGRLDSESDT